MNTFFYRTASVAASEVELVFSKESRTKTDATFSNKSQIQLKKVFAAVKIQKQPPQVFCKRTPATLLKRGFRIAKFLRTFISKNICERLLLKITISVTNYRWKVNPDFFYPFETFRILNFAMTEWFCHVTYFVKVLLIFFFS